MRSKWAARVAAILLIVVIGYVGSGCVSPGQGGGGSTTQPAPIITLADMIRNATANLDQWTATAEVLGKIALGPNPSQKAVDDYNRAVYMMEWFRSILKGLGATVPAAEPPPMVKLDPGGRATPVRR